MEDGLIMVGTVLTNETEKKWDQNSWDFSASQNFQGGTMSRHRLIRDLLNTKQGPGLRAQETFKLYGTEIMDNRQMIKEALVGQWVITQRPRGLRALN